MSRTEPFNYQLLRRTAIALHGSRCLKKGCKARSGLFAMMRPGVPFSSTKLNQKNTLLLCQKHRKKFNNVLWAIRCFAKRFKFGDASNPPFYLSIDDFLQNKPCRPEIRHESPKPADSASELEVLHSVDSPQTKINNASLDSLLLSKASSPQLPTPVT